MGGHNILPMKDLRGLLDGLGLQDVRTYIQSGNCVFKAPLRRADQIEKKIGAAIEDKFGFHPHVIALKADAYNIILAENPYRQSKAEPKNTHIFFLAEPAGEADLDALDALRRGKEAFMLTDRAFYLFAPDGIGNSKLAAKVERHVPVQMTGRNLRTVVKVSELARSIS